MPEEVVARRLPASLIAALVLVLTAAGPAAAASPCAHARASRLAPTTAARALRCLLNAERRAHGLRAVHVDRHLTSAAARHAADMVRRGYFGHVSPDGATPVSRIRRTGYLRHARVWDVGEALARARRSPRAILRMLLNSPPHRAILLDPQFRDLGLGVAGGGGAPLTVTFDLGRVTR